MSLKKVRYLIFVLGGVLFLTAMAAYWLHSWVLAVISLGLCVAIVAVSLAFWRCPHCGAHPGRVDGKPKFCPNCGKRLEDFE